VCEEGQRSLLRWGLVEAVTEGSSTEKSGMMLLKPAAVGVGRVGPELTHHTKLHPQATDLRLYVTV